MYDKCLHDLEMLTLLLCQMSTLTNEGGRLKRDVVMMRGKDFELVPEPVWRALSNWYGSNVPLPRSVSHTNFSYFQTLPNMATFCKSFYTLLVYKNLIG